MIYLYVLRLGGQIIVSTDVVTRADQYYPLTIPELHFEIMYGFLPPENEVTMIAVTRIRSKRGTLPQVPTSKF